MCSPDAWLCLSSSLTPLIYAIIIGHCYLSVLKGREYQRGVLPGMGYGTVYNQFCGGTLARRYRQRSFRNADLGKDRYRPLRL